MHDLKRLDSKRLLSDMLTTIGILADADMVKSILQDNINHHTDKKDDIMAQIEHLSFSDESMLGLTKELKTSLIELSLLKTTMNMFSFLDENFPEIKENMENLYNVIQSENRKTYKGKTFDGVIKDHELIIKKDFANEEIENIVMQDNNPKSMIGFDKEINKYIIEDSTDRPKVSLKRPKFNDTDNKTEEKEVA